MVPQFFLLSVPLLSEIKILFNYGYFIFLPIEKKTVKQSQKDTE